MNVKKQTGMMRKIISTTLTVAMLFTNAQTTLYAAEEERTPKPVLTEETVEEETMQEEEAVLETVSSEMDFTEENEKDESSFDEHLDESDLEKTAESAVEESSKKEDSNIEIEENKIAEESSVGENDDVLMSGVYENITWSIDGDGKLLVEGTGKFSADGKEESAPWYIYREKIISAEVNVCDITDVQHMFYGCNNLKSVDFRNFDTSQVTKMKGMFHGCSSLESLDLSSFDTRQTKMMNNLFRGCSSLKSITFGSLFDTSGVTSIGAMFRECGSLLSLDLSGFDTRSATDLNGMFWGCSSLTELDLSGFNTSSVTGTMNNMFFDCSNLTSLNISSFDTSNVTKMNSMFKGCSSLTELDLHSFNTSNVTEMNNMFKGCSSLESLDLSRFNMGNVTGTPDIFSTAVVDEPAITYELSTIYTPYNLSVAIALPEGDWYDVGGNIYTKLPVNSSVSVLLAKGERPAATEEFFTAVKKKTEYKRGDKIALDDLSVFYYGSDGTSRLLDSSEYTTNVEDIDTFTLGKKILTVSYDNGNEILQVDVTLMVSEKGGQYGDVTWNIDMDGKLTVTGTGEYAAPALSEEGYWIRSPWYEYREDILSANINITGIQNASCMFRNCSNLKSVDVRNFDTSQIVNMEHMFYGCASLENLDTSGFRTQNVILMDGMFEGCASLKNIDVSSFDTRNVTWMAYMFKDCGSLQKIDVSGFNTSQVGKFNSMFYGCSNLQKIDVSGFNTQNAIDMNRMFYGCSSLESIDVSTFDTGNVTEMQHMFRECRNLRNITFGDKFDTSNVTNMLAMFRECNSLQNLDLSGFHTENVTEMQYMFTDCSSLTMLDLSSFNTISAPSLKGMFSGCEKLVSVDLSSFNTENVTDMTSMFSECKKLTELDLSNFNAVNVTEMSNMFRACDALMAIHTPCNLSIAFRLPAGTWRDVQKNIYTELPTGKNESILLTREKNRLTMTKTKKGYYCGETVNVDDLKVTYYGSGETVRVLESNEYTTNAVSIDTSTAGEKTLTVTYVNEEESETLTASIKLTVTKKEESGETQESSNVEESSEAKESSDVEESSEAKESSDVEESSSTEESSVVEESGSTEESIVDKDDSSYEDSERTDLKSLDVIVSGIKTKVYDGNPYEPVVKVTAVMDGKKQVLTEGADYRVLYKNNVNAGTGTVIIRGNGIFRGEIDEDFTIDPKPVKKLKIVTGSISEGSFDKDLSGLPVYVYDGAKLLELNKDYTFSDFSIIKESSVQVVVNAVENGNYEGWVSAKLTVYESSAKIINFKNVKLENSIMPYTGKAVKPKVTVVVNETTLDKKDYKVQYQNNKNAGTAFVIVTGKKEYKGKVTVPFTIKAETVQNNAITIKEIPEKTYNAKLQKPSVAVSIQKDGKTKKLSKNKDYTVSYENNFHAGTAKVIVKGKGNYAGLMKTGEFTITAQNIKKASIKGTQKNLIVMYGKQKLIEGTDYEKPVFSEQNKNKVKVTLKGKGDFMGEVTKTVKK